MKTEMNAIENNCKTCKHWDTQDAIGGRFVNKKDKFSEMKCAGWCTNQKWHFATLSSDGCRDYETSM